MGGGGGGRSVQRKCKRVTSCRAALSGTAPNNSPDTCACSVSNRATSTVASFCQTFPSSHRPGPLTGGGPRLSAARQLPGDYLMPASDGQPTGNAYHLCPPPATLLWRPGYVVCGGLLLFVCFAQRPSYMLVYLRDGSALTVVLAATLR